MLAYIKGRVIHNDLKTLIVVCENGLGYQVTMTDPVQVGEQIELYLAQIIREDAHTLYGFHELVQRTLFEKLTTVSGVGPKSAYSLIATVGVEGIVQAILTDSQNILKSAPGIGAKVAAKIVLELSDKMQAFSASKSTSKNQGNLVFEEVVEACVGLGFKDKDVLSILKNNPKMHEIKNASEVLKLVLKELSA
jgi:holliday junction DNA helicase RuvA